MTRPISAPFACLLAALVTAAVCATAAGAENWPNRAVHFIIPFPAGGASDGMGRVLAHALGERLGQQIVIENRTGAAGAIGAGVVANAEPDGYTFLIATSSTHAVIPVLDAKLGYDPIKNFTPVGMVGSAPNLLVASPTLPVNSVGELIAYVKARPGEMFYASSGTGAITHVIAELLKLETGIEITHVPYRGGVQAAPDVTSGRIAYLFDSIIWTLPLVRGGQLKGLGMAGLKRSPLAPDIPTVAETVPGFEGVTWFGVFGPAGVATDIVARLNREIAVVLQSEDTIRRYAALGVEPAASSPEELTAFMKKDMAKWADVIKRAGIKLP